MALSPEEIVGLVRSTEKKLIKKGAFTNLRSDLTEYVGVNELFKNHKVKFEGGKDWEFAIQHDDNHSARVTGLYDDDTAVITDDLQTGSVGPRFVNANYVFDVREKALQGGNLAIVDYVYSKHVAMLESFYKLLENIIWSKPESSADKKTPFGVGYWLTKDTRTGFNGGNPAGFADGRAGIDSTRYTRWKNYTGTYKAVSKEDLIRTMRQAARKTAFKSAVNHAEPTFGKLRNGVYTNDNVVGLVEEALEAQNMNLGQDIASQDGRALFKGRPIVYVPQLDDDSTDPVYMIDWATIAFGTIAGWQNHISAPAVVPGKHNVRSVFLDAALNMVCTNLRRNCVFYKVTE